MNTEQKFIDDLVKVEFLEQFNIYGHFPFSLLVEKKDGTIDLNALALGGDVVSCFNRAKHYLNDNPKTLFLSLDYPIIGDMKKDFVAIFSVIEGKASISAIPYSTKTGKTYKRITKSETLDKILGDFKHVTKIV